MPVQQSVRFGPYVLDADRAELRHGQETVHLAGKPIRTLIYLIEHRDRWVSKEELLASVWDGVAVCPNTVEQAVRKLRRALDDPPGAAYIQTQPRSGYRFVGDLVEPAPAEVPHVHSEPPRPQSIPVLRLGQDGFRRISTVWIWAVAVVACLSMLYMLRPLRVRVTEITAVTATGRPKRAPVVFASGTMFVNEVQSGLPHITRLADGGAPQKWATKLQNPYVCAASRNGTEVLVRTITRSFDDAGPMYIVSLSSGAVVRLAIPDAFDGIWSGDGTRIATAGPAQVNVVNASDHTSMLTIPVQGFAWWVRWGPGDRVLRFNVTDLRTQRDTIWEAQADGSGLRRLFTDLKGPESVCCGDWMNDGNFVFTGTQGRSHSLWASSRRLGVSLWMIESPHMLTVGPINFRGPVPGPSSRVYARAELVRGILTRVAIEEEHAAPVWTDASVETADFAQTVISYTALPENSLWIANPDGSERVRLSREGERAALPRFSRDSQRLAVMLRNSGEAWRIAVISLRSRKPVYLTDGRFNASDPDWAEDGQIVFGAVPALSQPQDVQLYSIDTTYTQTRALPNTSGLYSPTWRPNSQSMAALDAQSSRVVLYDLSAQSRRELTAERASSPMWSADGRYLYYVSIDQPEFVVKRIDLVGGITSVFYRNGNVSQPATTFGRWIGQFPNGDLAYVEDKSSQEIFQLQTTYRSP